MKRRLSRLAAFALTLVAVCAMVIVPASADAQTTVTFDKTLEMAEGTVLPADITFTYSIGSSSEGVSEETPFLTAGVGTPTITPETGLVFNNESETTQHVTVSFPEGTFTAPGIYRYKITESGSGLAGFSDDGKNDRYLDVVVTANGSGFGFTYNFLTLPAEYGSSDYAEGSKSKEFTDTFTTHDFGFSKAVEGNVGDHNKTFKFTLNITGALPGTYTVTSSDIEGAPTTITVNAEGNYTGAFNLKHGSSFSIAGLNDGAACTVTEDEDGYEPSFTVNDADETESDTTGAITLSADTTVAFTNSLSMTVPTGVLLTIAPFAVGLFLFGALAVFLVARKRQYEE